MPPRCHGSHPYSFETYRDLGIELSRVVRRRRRPPAKVLALDCDGVLWGGVFGEDGFDGIRIGPDGPGRSFQIFQRALVKLKLSAACCWCWSVKTKRPTCSKSSTSIQA